MWPWLIGGIGAWFLKARCSQCNSKKTLNRECAHCGKLVCGECGVDISPVSYRNWNISDRTRVCKIHRDKFDKYVSYYMTWLDKEADVKVYSINYKGKMPPIVLNKDISSDYFDLKEDAERDLRISAASNDCYVIQELTFDKKTVADGNYYHSLWKASGRI